MSVVCRRRDAFGAGSRCYPCSASYIPCTYCLIRWKPDVRYVFYACTYICTCDLDASMSSCVTHKLPMSANRLQHPPRSIHAFVKSGVHVWPILKHSRDHVGTYMTLYCGRWGGFAVSSTRGREQGPGLRWCELDLQVCHL